MRYPRLLRDKWSRRPRYRTFSSLPTSALAISWVASSAMAWFFGVILTRSAPALFDGLNLGWWRHFEFIFFASLVILVATLSSLFGAVGIRCKRLLRERLFE
jgi:hypothetical protein